MWGTIINHLNNRIMRKNIVEVVSNNKGEVIEEVADYIGVESFAKTIEELYRECLENYDNAAEMEELIADYYGVDDIKSLAWKFTLEANRDMKKYLHMKDHKMIGNFANIETDYPAHITGARWRSEYDGDDYSDLFPQMVSRLDSAEDSKRADEDRAYLEMWFFFAFGTYNIEYNFSNDLAEIEYALEEEYAEA